MQQQTINVQKIIDNGWKQGASFQVDPTQEIFIDTQCGKDRLLPGWYIVLSQDCDLISPSLEKEPVIELIFAQVITKMEPNCTYGKNPRKLHLNVSDDLYMEFIARRKFMVTRKCLETLKAGKISLIDNQLKLLIDWIIKRYKRPAFPGEFNRRIEEQTRKNKKFVDILKNFSINTRGIYFNLGKEKNEDLPPGKNYFISVIMLVDKDVYEDEIELKKIVAGFDKILKIINEIEGIKVIDNSKISSLDEITLHEYIKYKQFDFDYLSFNGEEQGVIASDISP